MYYSLWRNDEDIPNPYTFNTNSLDDIRNYLAWDIVDSFTFGKERLKGSSLSTYNLSAIDWNQYGTKLDEVIKTIKTAYSKCTDEVIKKYKSFDTNYYNKSIHTGQLFYNIDITDQYTLVISESSFDAEECFSEYLEANAFMIGKKPWL